MTDADHVTATYSTLDASDWSEVLAQFDDACIEQSHGWASARGAAGHLRHLVVRRSGQIVAAAQVAWRRVPWLNAGIALVKFGPLWRRRDAQPDPAALSDGIRALRRHVADATGSMLRLVPAAGIEPSAVIEAFGDGHNCRHRQGDDATRYLVDLGVERERRLAGLKPKWRYNLRRAGRRGLTVTRADDDATLDAFAQLYADVRRRKAFSDGPDPNTLRRLVPALPAGERPTLFGCWREGNLVAGALVATLGNTASYLVGATAADALPLGAGYLLQWEITCALERTACRYYDLGGDCGEPGLRQFKSGLAGSTGLLARLPGSFDYSPSLRSRAAGTLAFALRDAAARRRR